MPLLLRRSAPSPSVDELAFAIPAAPLSGLGPGASRSSSGNEAQLQRCSTHARLTMRRRRSTAGTEGELSASVCDCAGSLRASQPSLRDSTLYEAAPECQGVQCEAPHRDSKRLSGGGSSQQEDDQTSSSDCGFGSEAGRVSSAPSCACSLKDDDLFLTASSVMIEDQQLAVVDMELRDLRKTFAKKLYSRLTHSFARKKRPASTPNLGR